MTSADAGNPHTNKPLGIVDVDLQKMGFGLDKKTDLKAV